MKQPYEIMAYKGNIKKAEITCDSEMLLQGIFDSEACGKLIRIDSAKTIRFRSIQRCPIQSSKIGAKGILLRLLGQLLILNKIDEIFENESEQQVCEQQFHNFNAELDDKDIDFNGDKYSAKQHVENVNFFTRTVIVPQNLIMI
ncbi:hypothetical protein CHS0354_039103 [Potamilus streckersoni]|uniref:Uncharacterized protein n=1 Tax=Potamilus streckersoni TaxID=2493646 RepID=A0AAE0WEQ2_9BIVA|nr:hypothetical protein CHS0354_039103 [Potamilus streckersoni]